MTVLVVKKSANLVAMVCIVGTRSRYDEIVMTVNPVGIVSNPNRATALSVLINIIMCQIVRKVPVAMQFRLPRH